MALVDVVLGYDCNLACDYCTITPEMRRRSLPTRDVLEAIATGRRMGFDAVAFTGGEPTIRPDLIGLVRSAARAGYRDIKVQSNGLMFSYPEFTQKLLGAGANRIHVSIHTHDANAYDTLVGRAGSHALMVRGLDAMVASRIALTVDVILKEDTYRRLPAALEWLHARGVRSVHLWFVSLTDGNRENVKSMPRMTDVTPTLFNAFQIARVLGMDVRSLHVPRCLLGEHVDRAYDPGADRVWVVTPEASFELKDSRLAGREFVAACDGCAHRAVCPGIRPDYLARFGDAEFAAARGQLATRAGHTALPVLR